MDLIGRVLLKADGTGLVGQVRPAVKVVQELASATAAAAPAMAKVGQASTQATAGIARLAQGEAAATVAAGELGRAAAVATSGITDLNRGTTRLTPAVNASVTALAAMERELAAARQDLASMAAGASASAAAIASFEREIGEAGKTIATLGSRIDILETRLKRANAPLRESAEGMDRNAFATRNLGQQFGDLAVMIQGGISPARAFATQAGQMGYAMGEFEKGPLKRVGAFLVGPWGIALTIAAAAFAPFVEKLLSSNDALEEQRKKLDAAAQSADSWGNAQSLLGKIIDLQTGKLKTHNAVLIETIRLQAEAWLLAGQADEKKARKSIGGLGKLSFLDRIAGGAAIEQGYDGDLTGEIDREKAPLRQLRSDVLAGGMSASQIRERVDVMAKAGQLAGYTAEKILDLKQQLFSLPQALNDQQAAREALNAIDGKGVSAGLTPYEKPKAPKKPKKTPDTDALVADVQGDVASILAEFTDAPTFIEKARAAVAKLDVDIDKLRKKKPPNFEALIASAEQAKQVIRDNIAKPYDDFIESQQEALSAQRLLAGGRADEAAALKIVLGLQRDLGPLTELQRDGVLATVQALRVEERQIDVLHAKQQRQLAAIGDIRAAVRGVVFDGVDGIEALPGRLVKAFSS